MKKTLVLVVLILAAIAGLIVAYLEMRTERDLEATVEAPVVAPSRVERGSDGSAVMRVDAETQKRVGLQAVLPVAGTVVIELTAVARVLDGASLSTTLNEMRLAQIALDAARTDYERKKKLLDNGQNASASAVEQAEALAKQKQLTLEAARDHIAATWGQAIAPRDDLSVFARSLLQREAALVRVELLPTDKLAAVPQTLRLFRQSSEPIAAAQVLGPASATDSTVAGQSFLCLVTTNAAPLVPGSMLLARIETGASQQGIVLPRSAVVRHAGFGWSYVQTTADSFVRRVVPLDRPHPDGWLVTGEWNQPVVISGVQSLLSEELKGTIQMKD